MDLRKPSVCLLLELATNSILRSNLVIKCNLFGQIVVTEECRQRFVLLIALELARVQQKKAIIMVLISED